MKRRTKFFDFVCFVIGPILTAFSLVGFNQKAAAGFSCDNCVAILNYPLEAKVGVATGVALICFGFLRIYWRKA